MASKLRAYLHERGFTDNAIRDLRLGLYLDSAGLQNALQGQGHPAEDIKASEVIRKKLEGYITFPWGDEYGRPLTIYGTWSSRTPPNKDTPKKKALKGEGTKAVPYGFDRARRAGHKDLVLVEGLTDGALCQVMGDTRVVACVGAELSHLQVETLKRHRIRSVTICLDPDSAGDNGIRSCVRQLIQGGINAYVAPQLPDGLDPDDFLIKHGIEAWRGHIAQAIHSYRYKAELIIRENKTNGAWTDQGRDVAVEEAIRFAALLPRDQQDQLFRHFWPELVKEVGGDEKILQEKAQKLRAYQSNGKHHQEPADNEPQLEWAPFPVKELPGPVCRYVVAAARAIGCDVSMIVLALLAGLSSAIGNSRRIKLKKTWSEPALIWSGIVGESGTLKSPAAEAPLGPILARQAAAMARFQRADKEYDKDKLRYDAEVASWKRKKRQERGEMPERPEKPVCDRSLCSDITIEALAARLLDAPRGLIVYRDELSGWLRSFDCYKPGGRGPDVSRWLELHGARNLIVDRKSTEQKTIFVPRAFAAITGGIQPTILAQVLGREHFEDGLAARILFCMPPQTQKVWTDFDIDDEHLSALADLYSRLYGLDLKVNETTGYVEPTLVPLSSVAKDMWEDFYNAHAAEQIKLSGDLASAWSKLEGYGARLALLFHCCRSVLREVEPEAIDEQSMHSAIVVSRWFAAEARRVYAVLGGINQDQNRDKLIELIQRKGGTITARELMRASRKYRHSVEAAEQALNALVDQGFAVRQMKEADGSEGGRPLCVWRLT
jgi:hypothetical protein